MRTTATTTINKQPQKIWDFIIDPANLSKWLSIVKNVEVINKDFEHTGTKANIDLSLAGHSTNAGLSYTTVDAPKTLKVNINSDVMFSSIAINLAALNDNETTVTIELEVELDGIASFISIPKNMLDSALTKTLEDLKSAL